MMNLFIETDIGRDPDDLFALCYLFEVPDVRIKSIAINPGDRDQLALVEFLLNELKQYDTTFGPSKPGRDKSSVSGIHLDLMAKYGKSTEYLKPTKPANKLFHEALDMHGDSNNLFIIGPMTASAQFLDEKPGLDYVYVQGGYTSYEEQAKHGIFPSVQLEKFVGKHSSESFNLNGDKKASLTVINNQLINKRFISKNLCHTITYDRAIHEFVMSIPPKSRAGELLREGMGIYLQKHNGKHFHDPLAAVAMIHPEIFTWAKGNMYYEAGKWFTIINPQATAGMACDVDRDTFWFHIANGN